MLAALAEVNGPDWSAEQASAWAEAIDAVIGAMLRGADEAGRQHRAA